MSDTHDFELTEDLDPDALEERLAARCALGRRRRFAEEWTFFDTFDWRLHAAGYRLRGRRRGQGYELRLERPGGGGGGGGRRQLLAAPPAFAASLPGGPLARAVAPLAGNRRLLPRAGLHRRGLAWKLLDGRRKTVARLYAEERRAICPDPLDPPAATAGATEEGAVAGVDGHPLAWRLRLVPLTGYGDECRPVAALLAAEPGLAPAAEGDDLDAALAACGRRAGDYSSKIRSLLSPEQPAAEAVRDFLGRLLATLTANEPGVRGALDPEFLHDFRVSVRRTRSALGQLSGVFAGAAVEPYRDAFRWLGRVTGPKRDLDVFQEDLAGHLKALPPRMRRDLEPLSAFLRGRSAALQEELVAALDSDDYRRLVEGWRRFLEAPAAGEGAMTGPDGRRPAAAVASERIGKAERKVARRAAAIDASTPAAQVHRLRIDCKKLRYLLELFRSLFPEDEIGAEIDSLKRLQDVLGEFNDLAVQQAALRRYAGELSRGELQPEGEPAPAVPADVFLAMGFLLARLHRRQKSRRQQLTGALQRYLEEANRERRRRLFGPAGVA